MIKNTFKSLLILIFSLYLPLPSFAMDDDIQLINQATTRLNQRLITLENENNALKVIGNRSKYKLSILQNVINQSFLSEDETNEFKGQSIRASLVFGVASIYHNGQNLLVEVPEGQINGVNYFTVSGMLNIPTEGEEQTLNIPAQNPIYGNTYAINLNDQSIESRLDGFILNLSIGDDLDRTLPLTSTWIERYASLNGNLVRQD